MLNVKIRLKDGRHWHLIDCGLAQDADYIEVPLILVLDGHYSPLGTYGECAYRLCPGCRIRIKDIALEIIK